MIQQQIPAEAVEAAARTLCQFGGLNIWDREDGATRNYYQRNAKSALNAAAPHMLAQKALDSVLDISNVRVDSDYGNPAFVAGWESALEEVQVRIKEAMGGSENA